VTGVIWTAAKGPQHLTDPLTNKGTAFTADERRRLHLEGRLPPRVESLEEQTVRVLANLHAKTNPLEQYRYLSALQNENETLFYRVALDHLEETLPIIYTPTVGEACLEWSRLYERPGGCISQLLNTRVVLLICFATGPDAPASSSSPTAAASLDLAISVRTAWGSRSAN
jgi:hypothetical protein